MSAENTTRSQNSMRRLPSASIADPGTNRAGMNFRTSGRVISSVSTQLIAARCLAVSVRPPSWNGVRPRWVSRRWTNYIRYAACKRTLSRLFHFVWSRVIRWFRALHHWTWKDVRRRFTTPDGPWKPIGADGITLFNRARSPRFLRPRRRVRSSSPYPH